MKQEIPWSKFAVEAFVIVGSILLAFAIDAGWSERQERKQESRLLENLHAEFSETKQLLIAELPRHTARKNSSLEAALFSSTSSAFASSEIISNPRAFIAGWIGYSTTHPKTGVLDGALATGQLGIISSDELRSLLAGWRRVLEEYTEQTESIRELVSESRQLIAQNAPIVEVVLRVNFVNSQQAELNDLVLSNALAEFLSTEAAQNYMALRAWEEGFAERDGNLLLESVENILQQIELEIE